MELGDVLRRRRMCRDFSDRPVPAEVVDRLLDRAGRAPSAGFTQGWSFLVLDDGSSVARFWSVLADEEWRRDPSLPGLMRAPVVIVPLCNPEPYVARYSEPDKVAFGLTAADRWPVPYWTVDVSFATMLLLLGAVEEGLGALFFGRDAAAYSRLAAEFGVPEGWSPIGVVLAGWPAPGGGPRGSAATRPRRPLSEVVHRRSW
ncbi:MAG TPA: nitroreductase family protein [Acidimicrobiales bacterium]|nr:nitroreductase family protein [Acidimicrobiales bacterium]